MKTTEKNLARRIAASSLLPRLLREFEGDEFAQAKIQAAYDDLYHRALAVYGTPEVRQFWLPPKRQYLDSKN